MRISDWSSDVCSSDLVGMRRPAAEMDDAKAFGDAAVGVGLCRERRGDPYRLVAGQRRRGRVEAARQPGRAQVAYEREPVAIAHRQRLDVEDRKSTRLNSSQ